MKSEKFAHGEDVISCNSFYSCEAEKIKLNWFCYELSLSIYRAVMENHGTLLKKCAMSDVAIANKCVGMSKKMKERILKHLSGKTKHICIDYTLIKSQFPNIRDEAVNEMVDTIMNVWDEHLSHCERCPTRCISDKDGKCFMFDDGPF